MRLRKADVTWQQLDDEIIILDLNGGEYLSVNGSGAFLWKQLDAGAEFEGLVSSLSDEYDLPRERAHDDVEAFLTQLREAGLLET